MSDIVTISPKAPEQISHDYDALRRVGLSHLEKMAKAIWTDYNAHDPGITMLELLSYAITDLGHRISFPIEDLLTNEKGKIEGQFFSAKEILTCNPLTFYDYRKLLIDIEGVRNAWLYVSKDAEIPIYANCADSILELVEQPRDIPLQLNGLYKIKLDIDEDITDLTEIDAILQAAMQRLHAHRNLSEDFYCIDVVEEEPIGICAEIEIANDADVETIEAEIIFQIDKFVNPPVPFYSLSAMYAKGKTSEEIFEGLVLDHGFIDKNDLAKSALKTEIHASDLYQIIMDIEGVLSIKKLLLIKFTDTDPPVALGLGEPWVLNITEGKKPVFRPALNMMTYFKESIIPYRSNDAEVAAKVDLLRILDEQANAVDRIRDIEIPLGEYFDFQDFTSIQEDLPETYGVSEFGLSTPSEKRKAQVKQLKGYLLFFDQILANFLAQLFQAKSLFAVDQASEASYFTQLVLDAPNVRELFSDYTGSSDEEWENFKNSPATLQRFQDLMESEELLQDRQNRILDHLLARFSENFNDYALLMFQFGGGGLRNVAEIIQDKRNFLSEYPALSRDRGKAYNYIQRDGDGNPELVDSLNIAGLKQRVARLMGIDEVQRQSLVCAEYDMFVYPTFTGGIYNYQFRLFDKVGNQLLQGRGAYSTTAQTREEIIKIFELLQDPNNIVVAANKQVYVNMTNPNGTLSWRAISPIQPSLKAAQDLAEVLKKLICCPECTPLILYMLPQDENDENAPFTYQFVDADEAILLKAWDEAASTDQYFSTIAETQGAAQIFARNLRNEDNYQIEDNADDFFLQVLNEGEVIAQSELKDSESAALQLRSQIQELSCCEDCGKEGFYIVEHILLRPRNDRYQNLLPVCIKCDDCDCCTGLRDPYSFRISVVLPYWPERFQDRNFRYYFERILRMETPAHISLKICWVNCSQMSVFETCYYEWMEKKNLAVNNWIDNDLLTVQCQNYSDPNVFEEELATATDKLVDKLFNLRNVYPSATFHDCSDDDSSGGIILGNTSLGTAPK